MEKKKKLIIFVFLVLVIILSVFIFYFYSRDTSSPENSMGVYLPVKDLTFKNMDLKISSGDEKEFSMSIRNRAYDKDYVFYVQFSCRSCRTNFSSCGDGIYNDKNQWLWFDTLNNIPIKSQKSREVFIKVNAQGPADAYRGKIVVWKCEGKVGNPCPGQLCFDREGEIPRQEYIGDSCQDFDSSVVSISEHGSEQISMILSEERQ